MKNNKINELKAKAKIVNSKAQRREIITAFYEIIETKKGVEVFNKDLKKNICINSRSVRETRTQASKFTTFTLAVLELLDVLKNAKKVKEVAIKANVGNQKSFKKMIILKDSVKGIGEVKLTVGVTRLENKHIQYCLTALK